MNFGNQTTNDLGVMRVVVDRDSLVQLVVSFSSSLKGR